jgi:hypothetical protein
VIPLTLRGADRASAPVLPSGVREIDVRSSFPESRPVASVRVSRPATVAAIVRLFDGLERSHPYKNLSCPAIAGPTVSLAFRGGDGTLLAGASFVSGGGLAGLSAGCNPVLLTRDARTATGIAIPRPQEIFAGSTPSQDRSFVRRLQRLVGVPLCERSTNTPAENC